MPITDSTRVTLETREARFFDRPFSPEKVDQLADAVAAWLCSDELRWLVEHVPGRRDPEGPVEPLDWPLELDGPGGPSGSGHVRLVNVVDSLGDICDWSRAGTVWDYRIGGERPLEARAGSVASSVSAQAIAVRAKALGLCSQGSLAARPRTLVVLGGRRLAPLNRARAAALAIRRDSPTPTRVIFLGALRTLDRAERESPEVRSYAAGAHTEADLMAAAARHVLGVDLEHTSGPVDAPAGEVQLVEAPAPAAERRASTYDTLRLIADDLAIDAAAPVGLVTSPTCRPFQYLDAARALGLGGGLSFELIAHPRAWAAAPGGAAAGAHTYLQEIRSTVQAAGRLAAALSDGPVDEPRAHAMLA